MLKSVFSKYLVTFLIIIVLSFSVLSVAVATMISGYSVSVQREAVVSGAEAVSQTLSDSYKRSYAGSFSQFLYLYRDLLSDALSLASRNDDTDIVLVSDVSGVILLSDVSTDDYVSRKIEMDVLNALLSSDEKATRTDLGGVLAEPYLISANAIEGVEAGDADIGIVLYGSSATGVSGPVETMLKTCLIACMWAMIAAMIAVYVISERLSSPLREMSRAAKQYASGQFDVRVPVKGSDEVAELAQAFNHMANSLATVEEQRRSFLANVSHDLRTPMTTIAGFIDGILDGAISEDKQPYYLELIASEVRRLSRLVASLLDISRIQAGERKFTKTSFDICEMARQILISFEQRIDEKKLNIAFDCDRDNMSVYADRDAIHQVLYNICDNAVKFSAPAGLYRISITAHDKKTYVSVLNEGEGIPAAELPFVFDRFYKSDKSRGLDKTGVGLGLYITKTIMDAHGEEIWVKSVEGEYCEFVFTLQSVPSK